MTYTGMTPLDRAWYDCAEKQIDILQKEVEWEVTTRRCPKMTMSIFGRILWKGKCIGSECTAWTTFPDPPHRANGGVVFQHRMIISCSLQMFPARHRDFEIPTPDYNVKTVRKLTKEMKHE